MYEEPISDWSGWSPGSDNTSDYPMDFTGSIYTQPQSSLSGWVNAIGNLLPAVGSVIGRIYDIKREDKPMQYLQSPHSSLTENGINTPARFLGHSPLIPSVKSKDLFLYIIAGVLIIFLFLKK